ncbi:hypothetical protein M758_UG302400 [Ceratodon purpureus]|nr:hypothetical protein M758_UG302400 [Ceratodon purpureus]
MFDGGYWRDTQKTGAARRMPENYKANPSCHATPLSLAKIPHPSLRHHTLFRTYTRPHTTPHHTIPPIQNVCPISFIQLDHSTYIARSIVLTETIIDPKPSPNKPTMCGIRHKTEHAICKKVAKTHCSYAHWT